MVKDDSQRYFTDSGIDVLFRYMRYGPTKSNHMTFDYCYYTKQYDLRLICK